MSELIGLVSEDSRPPIQRLRRSQLWKVADAYKIAYPKDAPATVMVAVLEGAGVDVTRPLPAGEQVIQMVPVTKENGSVVMEAAPIEKPHATLGKNIDYDALLEQQTKNNSLQVENTAMADSLASITARLDALDKESVELKTQNAELVAQNEALTEAAAGAKPVTAPTKKKKTVKAKSNGEDLT